ncbi:MAG: mismatch-specific DNA-glycosylase [Dehalococcoidia bacterium]
MTQLMTLPDLLRPGLDLVFVGINPGSYSARRGHYYARPGNLFWWALHQSGLVDRALGPEDDTALLEMGIGFTDVAKRPSDSASEIAPEEFRQGAGELLEKLYRYRPTLVCFNGLTGYAYCFGERAQPGPRQRTIGPSRVFVVPSTSRRNAYYQRDQILHWFQRLREYLEQVKRGA